MSEREGEWEKSLEGETGGGRERGRERASVRAGNFEDFKRASLMLYIRTDSLSQVSVFVFRFLSKYIWVINITIEAQD